MFTELDALLQHLGQGVAASGPHFADTSNTSANESKASHPRRFVRSKCTYKMKKVWGADEVGRLFVTGATDEARKPSHFYFHICRKDVSLLTRGWHEVLRHFRGVKQFASDNRLRLQTPGWPILDFEGNPLSDSELERQKERILGGPLAIRDREYPFAEALLVDDSGAPDATLPVLAKVSSLIEMLQLGVPWELVYQLLSQLTLTASRNNINVTWSRNEVLIGNFLFHVSTYPCAIAYWCYVLIDHFERDVPPQPLLCVRLGEGA